jgi:hypothetical protein
MWHLASLDAPTVAIVWSWGFAWAAGVHLPAWAPILLALVAWAIYVGDRLLDAHAGMQTPPRHQLRDRHSFHWRHRRILAPLALMGAGASLWIVITRLPEGARMRDSAVAAATLVYFSGVHSRYRLPVSLERRLAPVCTRAALIGALFTAGCLLPVWSQLPAPVASAARDRFLMTPALFFAVVGWLNCHAIAQWESAGSDAHIKGLRRVASLVGLLGAGFAVLIAACGEPRPAMLIATGSASAALLALLDRLRSRLTPLALRAGADLVLLTPVLLMAFERAPK